MRPSQYHDARHFMDPLPASEAAQHLRDWHKTFQLQPCCSRRDSALPLSWGSRLGAKDPSPLIWNLGSGNWLLVTMASKAEEELQHSMGLHGRETWMGSPNPP